MSTISANPSNMHSRNTSMSDILSESGLHRRAAVSGILYLESSCLRVDTWAGLGSACAESSQARAVRDLSKLMHFVNRKKKRRTATTNNNNNKNNNNNSNNNKITQSVIQNTNKS